MEYSKLAILLFAFLASIGTFTSASEEVEPTWQVQIANAREIMDPHNHPHVRRLENYYAESRRTSYSRQLHSKGNSKGNSKGGGPPAPPTTTDPNSLTSFFELELSTMDGNPTNDDIANALHIFVSSYNDLKTSSYTDPLERTMVSTEVEYISHTRRRRTLDEDDAARQLQNLNILLFLRVSGSCNGCGFDPFFTNQVVGRKRQRQRNRELFDHPVSNSMRAGVPSEAETLIAYSNSLRSSSMDLGSVVDAVFLDETEPPSTGKGTKKSGKASGKGMPSVATPTDPNTLTSFFELQLSTTNSSPTESEIERALDLFVRSYNDLKGGFNDPLERIMVDAQLESMTMEQARTMTIPTNRRRDDVHPHRDLQNLNVLLFLRVSGACNGCQFNPFFTNQVVGRKRHRRNRRELFDHPISSLRSGVPSAAETLNAYSLRLQAEDLGSIIDAISLAEMAALPTMSGKGTKKSSGKGTKKSGKGTGFSEDGGINLVGNVLTSFFEIELQTSGGNPTDSEIQNAVDAMVETYNSLTTESFVDPLERKMTSAAVVESRGRRRRTQSSRNLQNLNVLLFLRVSGSCLGCSNNAFFTNQVVGRRRQLFDKSVSEDLQEGVPTEAEVLEMYSDRITSGNFGSIVDAIGLDEVEALPAGKGSKKSSGKATTSMRRNSPMTQATAREAPLDVSLSAVTVSYPVVQVKMSSQEGNKCMSYTPGSEMIKVETCSSDDSTTDSNDLWEVISGWNGVFKLRHKNSQLCLPQDPDAPGDEFSCFAGTGADGEAMAHRIRGLFDCASPNVATVGFSDTYNPTALYHQECASGLSPGKDDDIILMSYVEGEDVAVVWGEKIMLDLEGVVSNRGMQGSWSFQEL